MKRMAFVRRFAGAVTLALIALCAGCVVGPDYRRPRPAQRNAIHPAGVQ